MQNFEISLDIVVNVIQNVIKTVLKWPLLTTMVTESRFGPFPSHKQSRINNSFAKYTHNRNQPLTWHHFPGCEIYFPC